ncbi:MAG TPA: glycoside hydrolase family 3 C-terminal domain-containing protein [Chitinophagaceae bacterium]|nr:glycoside hydrolase family 3 C-terminal domain-containing protein [Chitinophagaceae bacterium]
MKQILCLLGMLVSITAFSQNISNKAKQLVAKMTLEEKAKLVVGVGMHIPGMQSQGTSAPKEKVPGAAGNTFAISRLGIPSIVLSDGPAGVRIEPVRNNDSSKTYYATAWPVGTLLASSWDTSLVKKVGVGFGSEIHDYGIDVILAPAQNIQRNPLNGRNFEYYSEDPVLSGTISAAMVEGIQSKGVGTSVKHFVANNQETDRNTINEIISERALREIYLKNFEITVKKAQPWTVMSSYNKINGTYTSESYDLLTTILRNEWGFKGLVMTDWFGGTDAVAQMKAHNDLLMPGTPAQTKAIVDAVKNGTLDEKALDENAGRVLDLIFKSPAYKNYKYSDKPDLKKDAIISRDAAEGGMVLLKDNDNALPFKKGTSDVALFGINGYDLIAGGTGSGQVNKAYTVSLSEGLSNAGYTVNADVKKAYTDYLQDANAKRPKQNLFQSFMHPLPPISEYLAGNDLLSRSATDANIAIIAIGRNAGEGRDRKVENDFNLSDTEKILIKNVADAFHAKNKMVVVVLNIGGVVEVASWRDNVDAILLAWQPGLEGGNAITALLSGKVNPSGKLAQTFPVSYDDVPSAKSFPGKEFPDQATTGNFGMKQIPAEATYDDGIYVGYRYYTSYNVKPAYAFGYGLSYTSFSYSNLKLSSATFNGKMNVSVTVTNTGKVAGKEVAELYISAPADKLNKPAEELKAFAKTGLLQPGKSETIKFTLNAADLASFNTDRSSWIADAGTYEVKVGAASDDIRQSKSFSLPKEIVVEKVHKVMIPQVGINEMNGK